MYASCRAAALYDAGRCCLSKISTVHVQTDRDQTRGAVGSTSIAALHHHQPTQVLFETITHPRHCSGVCCVGITPARSSVVPVHTSASDGSGGPDLEELSSRLSQGFSSPPRTHHCLWVFCQRHSKPRTSKNPMMSRTARRASPRI